MSDISVDELASFVYLATTREVLQVVEDLELGRAEADRVIHRLFAELLAFYQHLVLIYTANAAELDEFSLGDFGGQLNLALVEFASGPMSGPAAAWIDIRQLLSSEPFQALVGAYLAGDTAISDLSPDEWRGLLKLTSYETLSSDFMAMNHLVVFSRLLAALGIRYGSAPAALVLPAWLSRMKSTRREEAALKKRFMQAFPGRIR